ncbi:hypothetical protein ACVW0Y_003704 [Pseudomonas sp. TE3786]
MDRHDKLSDTLSDRQLALLADQQLPLAVRSQARVAWNSLAWNGRCDSLHSWRLARIDDEEIDRLASFYRRMACVADGSMQRHQQRIVQLLRARHQQDLALIRALALPGQVIVASANGQHSDFYQLADEQALSSLLWQHRLHATSLATPHTNAASNHQRLLATQHSQGHDSLMLLFTARPVVLQLDSSGVRLHGAATSYLEAAVDIVPAATQWHVQAETKKAQRAA